MSHRIPGHHGRSRRYERAIGSGTTRVVLIRPHRFRPNRIPVTTTASRHAISGAPRSRSQPRPTPRPVPRARLTQAGVRIHLFETRPRRLPDSVSRNHWFSTHSGGRIAVYPMYSPSRSANAGPTSWRCSRPNTAAEIIDFPTWSATGSISRKPAPSSWSTSTVSPMRRDQTAPARSLMAYPHSAIAILFDACEPARQADLSHQRPDVHRHQSSQ